MNLAHALALSFVGLLVMACGSAESDPMLDPPDAVADAASVDGALGDGAPLDAGRPDAGTEDAGRPDAGAGDSGRPDAGAGDSGRPDVGPPDAGGLCNAGAIRRIPRSPDPVMVGTYCDALYACASDRAEAARIQAASSRFVCTEGAAPASGCGAFTCTYTEPGRREPYDAVDLRSFCPVTVLAPMPMMTCVVFI